eukprot:6416740-Pyramimonas_sp.AAC.1
MSSLSGDGLGALASLGALPALGLLGPSWGARGARTIWTSMSNLSGDDLGPGHLGARLRRLDNLDIHVQCVQRDSRGPLGAPAAPGQRPRPLCADGLAGKRVTSRTKIPEKNTVVES